jgi:hypothetical protein
MAREIELEGWKSSFRSDLQSMCRMLLQITVVPGHVDTINLALDRVHAQCCWRQGCGLGVLMLSEEVVLCSLSDGGTLQQLHALEWLERCLQKELLSSIPSKANCTDTPPQSSEALVAPLIALITHITAQLDSKSPPIRAVAVRSLSLLVLLVPNRFAGCARLSIPSEMNRLRGGALEDQECAAVSGLERKRERKREQGALAGVFHSKDKGRVGAFSKCGVAWRTISSQQWTKISSEVRRLALCGCSGDDVDKGQVLTSSAVDTEERVELETEDGRGGGGGQERGDGAVGQDTTVSEGTTDADECMADSILDRTFFSPCVSREEVRERSTWLYRPGWDGD